MNFLAHLFYRLYLIFSESPIKKTFVHPEYKALVKYAFSAVDENGEKHDFYAFDSAADMPTGRFTHYNEFMEDYNRRVDNAELVEILETMRDCMNQNSVEGVTNTLTLINYALQRTKISMDVDLFFRFMSVNYFTKDENLLNYDWDLANWKIDLWQKNGLQSFFLNEQVKKWLPSMKLSNNDLAILRSQKEGLRAFYKKLRDGLERSKSTTSEDQTGNGSS